MLPSHRQLQLQLQRMGTQPFSFSPGSYANCKLLLRPAALSEWTTSNNPQDSSAQGTPPAKRRKYQRQSSAQGYLEAAITDGVARQKIADHVNANWPQEGVVVTTGSVRGRASRTGAADLGTTPTDPRKTRCKTCQTRADDEEVVGAPLKWRSG